MHMNRIAECAIFFLLFAPIVDWKELLAPCVEVDICILVVQHIIYVQDLQLKCPIQVSFAEMQHMIYMSLFQRFGICMLLLQKCHICRKERDAKTGATSGCALSSCRKTYHFYCVASSNPSNLEDGPIHKRLVLKLGEERKQVMYR